MTNVYRARRNETAPIRCKIKYAGPDGHEYDGDFTLDPAPLLGTTTSDLGYSCNLPEHRTKRRVAQCIARSFEVLARIMRWTKVPVSSLEMRGRFKIAQCVPRGSAEGTYFWDAW